MQVDPPRGSQNGRALALMREEFPLRSYEQNEVVLLSCSSCTSLLDQPFARTVFRELGAKMEALHARVPEAVAGWDGATAALDMEADLRDLAKAVGTSSLVNPYLSPDGRTATFHTSWQFSRELEARTLALLTELMQLVTALDKRGRAAGFRVHISGALSISNIMVEELMKEMFIKEMFVTPIAILVLILQVRSVRLTVLSGWTMFVSVVVSLGALAIPAQFMAITSVCPVIVTVLGLALSVDYSLFIFARYREEVQAARPPEEALEIAMSSSGRVIALSGCILWISFLVCNVFPGVSVWCMAVTGMLVTFVVLITHLTLTPCMLAAFPFFFSYGLSVDSSQGGAVDPRGSKRWFQWGMWITAGWRPFWVILLMYGGMVPVVWQLATYSPTTDFMSEIPRRSLAEEGYRMAKASMRPGELQPVYILEKGFQEDIRSDAAFAAACQKIQHLVNSTKGTSYELGAADFTGPFTVPAVLVNLLGRIPGVTVGCQSLTCLRWSTSPPECPALPSAKEMLEGRSGTSFLQKKYLTQSYRAVWKDFVSESNRTALTRLTTAFDQNGALASPFHAALSHSHVDGFLGEVMTIVEMSRECYQRMPLILGLLLLVQCIFIGVAFGTLLVPLKLFFTVVLPIAFIYGVVVSVFQQGALDWTRLGAFEASGIYWLIPILTVSNLLGLAVDYDIFLFARVVEFREAGYDNKTAVLGGMATTGPPISSAGLIMSIAYSGMMFSSISLNNQMGFIIAFGVLVDTFLIRGTLVPCVLVLGDFMNYWPQKMPKVTMSTDDMVEYLTGGSTPYESRHGV